MPTHSNRPRLRKPTACPQSAVQSAGFGMSAGAEQVLEIDRWMCDAQRVGPRISAAWSRHLRVPRWRYLPRPSKSLAGALVLFCGDGLHPVEADKPGFAQMSYGYAREVIVLAVRRADRAILELVPDGEREFEQRLCQVALAGSDDVLAGALSAQRWRLTDSYRGFLSSWFAHGFGMAAIQHAHMFHVMLQRTAEQRLPARREHLEQELNRREVRVIRKARHQLFGVLDHQVVRAVRGTGAILTPVTYNFIATASSDAIRPRRLEALSDCPGLLPALLGKDPPLPDMGAAELLEYYRSGSDTRFPTHAQTLVDLVDQGKTLAPRIAGWLGQPRQAVEAARAVPPIVFWRLGEWGVRALLRTLDAIPPAARPRRLAQWMALRHIAVAVTELVEAFERRSEPLGHAVWSGPVSRLLAWAASSGWNDAVGAVWDESELAYLTFGIDRALTAEQDVAHALGIPVDGVLEQLAKLSFTQLLLWNQKWQRGLEDYRRRVEQRSPVAGQ
jgi:hypothetical protein